MTEEKSYGKSLLLEDGDIVFEQDDILMVEGRRNLTQALQLKVLTPYGSDIFNVNYGLEIKKAFTEPGTVRTIKDFIKLSLVKTLAADPRVRDIREVIFEDEPGYLRLHPNLADTEDRIREVRSSRRWNVEVIFVTVHDQIETLPVRVGV